MRGLVWAILLSLCLAAPSWALDKNLTTTIPAILYGIFDTEGNGITGRALTTDYVLKLKCRSNTAITLTGTPTEIGGGYYEMAPTNTVAVGTNYDWEDECIHWAEGAGAYAGLVAMAPAKFKALAAAPVFGTVVSSADCTNSATQFDTTLGSAYTGTNGPREAGLRFTSGALINEVRRIGGYNLNGCVSVNQAFSGAPTAGDAFEVVNQ